MKPHDKYLIFLMSAITATGARPGSGPSTDLDKQRAFNDVMAERFSEVSEPDRRAMIRRTLAKRPPISGGLDLLRLVESSSRKLSKTTEPRQAFQLLRSLLQIARASGEVTDTELLVLRAACAGLNLRGQVTLESSAGRVKLRRLRAAA